jgi:hypothetical protein
MSRSWVVLGTLVVLGVLVAVLVVLLNRTGEPTLAAGSGAPARVPPEPAEPPPAKLAVPSEVEASQPAPPSTKPAPETKPATGAPSPSAAEIAEAARVKAEAEERERQLIAAKARARADTVRISRALDDYALRNAGKYPESLEALVTPDQSGATYLGETVLPKDPWGNDYVYEPPTPESKSPEPRVVSWGPDGHAGSEDDIDGQSPTKP